MYGNMTLIIRQAKVEDAPFLAKAEKEIAEEPGFLCSLPSEISEQKIRETIETIEGMYLVAEKEGQIVGHGFLHLLHLQTIRHVAQLMIGIHKGHQEKGIGTKLLGSLIDWAKKSGTVEKIELNVRATNKRARALYKKLGFHEEGILKNRIKLENGYIDDILMALPIKSESTIHKLLVRPLQDGDIQTLGDLFFPWSTRDKTLEKWTRYLSEQEQGIRTAWVIEYQGEIAGYGSLIRDSEYVPFKELGIPEINDVWIYEQFRKRGFGAFLIEYLEKFAKSQGHRRIGIGVGLYRDYGQAQRLYFDLGYKPDGRGVTYKCETVIPGESYPVDDDLVLWLVKDLHHNER